MILLIFILNSCMKLSYSFKDKAISAEENKKVVEEIKRKIKEELDIYEVEGEPVGCYAVKNDLYEIIKMLIDKDYNFNIPDYKGSTPLMISCNKKDRKFFDLLVEKSNINLEDIELKNALYFAAISGNHYFIKELLRRNISINGRSSNLINLCLMSLSSYSQEDIDKYYESIKLLLEANITNKTLTITKNDYLKSFILLAYNQKDGEALELLKENEVDIDEYDPSYDEDTQESL